MSALTTVRSATTRATTTHFAIDTGWSSVPLCGAMKTGKREFGGNANCRPCIKEAKARYLDTDGRIEISSRVWNLINGVRAHAIENYDKGGWDVIVEAYSDHDLAEIVQGCRTVAGAIKRMSTTVAIYTDRQADARISAGEEDHPERVAPAKPESVIRWSGSAETEWYGVERWPGKVGRNMIEPDGTYYVSGFFAKLTTPNYCDHKPILAALNPDGHCSWDSCRHETCEVPF